MTALSPRMIARTLAHMASQEDEAVVADKFVHFVQKYGIAHSTPAIIEEMKILAQKEKTEKTLTIESPHPLSVATQRAIISHFNAAEIERVDMREHPELLLGFVAYTTTERIDASGAASLEKLRTALHN